MRKTARRLMTSMSLSVYISGVLGGDEADQFVAAQAWTAMKFRSGMCPLERLG